MDGKHKSRERMTSTQASQDRRTVVLDIETVALDPADGKGALDAMTGRIVCIGMLIDDGRAVVEMAFAGEDERRIISDFWDEIRAGDVIVGHNVIDFDLRFLQQRSWILGIRPSRSLDTRRYYTADVVDTLQLWTNWGGNKRGVTLDALGSALGCGRKTGEGTNVAQWWASRDLDRIKKYCRDDVRLAYRVFCRLTYREPRQFTSDAERVFSGSNIAVAADAAAEMRIA
jgi:hypothetical protein